MKVQVYQKLLKQCIWKFDTMLRTWNSFLRCNRSQEIQYGGRPPYWKSYFGYISAIYCSINAKFGTLKHNHVGAQVTWPKYQILKIQDGGRPPFWKWFYRYISAGNHPLSIKFGVQTQILIQGRPHADFTKKNMKVKMADSRHIENRILAISPRVIYCLIDAVFGMYK